MERSHVLRLGASLVGYALLLAFAVFQQWRGHDFVWAFWATGIAVIAYASFLAPFFGSAAPQDAFVTGLVTAAFVTAALVPFLFGPLAFILNTFVPIIEARSKLGEGGGILVDLIRISVEAFGRYWPVALIACLVRTGWIAPALKRMDAAPLLLLVFEAFFVAVLTVLAMVVEIFIGGLSRPAANVGGYVLMAVMLFPWFAVVELMRRKA